MMQAICKCDDCGLEEWTMVNRGLNLTIDDVLPVQWMRIEFYTDRGHLQSLTYCGPCAANALKNLRIALPT